MKAKIIFYSQKELNQKQKTKLKKELSGHNDTSHGGKYKYYRKGLLDTVTHIKPANGTLIIQEKDHQKVIKLLKKHNTKIKTYNLQINKTEFKN